MLHYLISIFFCITSLIAQASEQHAITPDTNGRDYFGILACERTFSSRTLSDRIVGNAHLTVMQAFHRYQRESESAAELSYELNKDRFVIFEKGGFLYHLIGRQFYDDGIRGRRILDAATMFDQLSLNERLNFIDRLVIRILSTLGTSLVIQSGESSARIETIAKAMKVEPKDVVDFSKTWRTLIESDLIELRSYLWVFMHTGGGDKYFKLVDDYGDLMNVIMRFGQESAQFKEVKNLVFPDRSLALMDLFEKDKKPAHTTALNESLRRLELPIVEYIVANHVEHLRLETLLIAEERLKASELPHARNAVQERLAHLRAIVSTSIEVEALEKQLLAEGEAKRAKAIQDELDRARSELAAQSRRAMTMGRFYTDLNASKNFWKSLIEKIKLLRQEYHSQLHGTPAGELDQDYLDSKLRAYLKSFDQEFKALDQSVRTANPAEDLSRFFDANAALSRKLQDLNLQILRASKALDQFELEMMVDQSVPDLLGLLEKRASQRWSEDIRKWIEKELDSAKTGNMSDHERQEKLASAMMDLASIIYDGSAGRLNFAGEMLTGMADVIDRKIQSAEEKLLAYDRLRMTALVVGVEKMYQKAIFNSSMRALGKPQNEFMREYPLAQALLIEANWLDVDISQFTSQDTYERWKAESESRLNSFADKAHKSMQELLAYPN